MTLTALGARIERALEGRERANLERYALPEFLGRQRWFAGKSAAVKRVSATPLGAIEGVPNSLLMVDVATARGANSAISCRVSVLWGEENLVSGAPKLSYTLAKVRHGAEDGRAHRRRA